VILMNDEKYLDKLEQQHQNGKINDRHLEEALNTFEQTGGA